MIGLLSSNKWLKERIARLGLEIVESTELGQELQKAHVLVNLSLDNSGREDVDPADLDFGDCTVAYGDSDVFEQIIGVLGMCLKHPGRSKWIVADYGCCGDTFIAIFAADSEGEAMDRVRKAMEAF